MRYSEFVSQVNQGRIRPVYLFHGEETFLVEEAISRLKNAVLTPGLEDLNYHRLNGPSTRVEEILHLCQTLPFLSSEPLAWPGQARGVGASEDPSLPQPHGPPHQMKRLVVVREVEALPGSEAFIPYLDQPSTSTCLVLVAAKADPKKRLMAALKTKGTEVAFNTLNGPQTKMWIKETARSLGVALSVEAMDYLQDRLGNDLYQIRNELEKLTLAPPGSGPLEVKDVEVLLTGERDHSVFEWLDAIRRREPEKALRLLRGLLDSGQYPLSLVGLLLSHLRRTARMPALTGGQRVERKDQGPDSGDGDLVRAFTLCLEADSRLKGSRLSPQFILEDLILNLCVEGNQKGKESMSGLIGRLSGRSGLLS